MKTNTNTINRTLTAETIAIIREIAKETAHSHKTLWGKPGVESMHRIGSEICHIVRKGTTERKAVKGMEITKDVREELALVLMDLGEDCGHHRDHTYRKIGRAVMEAVNKQLTGGCDDDFEDRLRSLFNDNFEEKLGSHFNNTDEAEEVEVEEADDDVEEVEANVINFQEVDDEVDNDEEIEVLHAKVDLPPDVMENLIHHLMENIESDNE